VTTWILLYAACSSDVTCPDGSAPVDDLCSDATQTSETDTDDPDDTGTAPTRDPALPPAAQEPAPLVFPDTFTTLSVAVRTADTTYAGTDDNSLTVCVTDTLCYKLDAADVDDFRVGELDVHHFEGLAISRGSVDRVEIRSESGDDQWRPECLALQFDGQPMYCADGLSDLKFGVEDEELQSWKDPDGLHLACASCDPTRVTHGPMLGALEPDTVRIWLRTDATRRVGMRVGLTAELDDADVVAWGDPSATDDYTLELQVGGLTSGVTYFAALEIDGELAPETALSFTTPPPIGTSGDTTFSFGSCSKYDDQPIFGPIAADDPDLFLFVGDNHYANSDHLDSLRWYYRWSLERPERAALVRQTVTLATWDDHDYVGNNTDGDDPGKDTAVRAFDEYWANRSVGSELHGGVFHSYEWQDLAFFFLDSRYFRGFEDSLIGDIQTAWLVDAVTASDATFKFLVSGSQWTLDGSDDSWAEYPEAREALFQSLFDQGVEGLVLLSGDIHRSEFLWLQQSGGYDLLELTSSPLANSNAGCDTRDGQLFCHDDDRYYVRVDVSTDTEDPWFVATLVNEVGDDLESVVVKHSELTLPTGKSE
jgi:alkaline phosphatase D